MKQRVLTALLLAPLGIAAVLLLPTGWLLALFAGVLLVGLWEWSRLVGLHGTLARAALVLVHAAMMGWVGWHGGAALLNGLVALGAGWWMLALLWLRFPAFGSGPSGLPLKLAVTLPMLLPAWCAVLLLHGDGALGPRWTLFAVLLTWAADTAAYLVGSRIGGRKLAPSISPGKTWAGFWGGLAGAVLLTLPAVPLLGLAWSQWPMLALVVVAAVLASVVGDLFESLIKRHSGSKDSGNLIPGHGGMMDRIDSWLAALPVFALGKLALGW